MPGRAVAVLLQALQLRRAEGRGQRPGHGHAHATGTHGTGVKEPPPLLGAGLSRAGGSGGRGRRPTAPWPEGNGRPRLGQRAANALAPGSALAPWPRMRGALTAPAPERARPRRPRLAVRGWGCPGGGEALGRGGVRPAPPPPQAAGGQGRGCPRGEAAVRAPLISAG